MQSARVIQALGNIPGFGGILRWIARQYPEGSVVTIKHGEAAGLKWKRHHRYVNGYWIGQYELDIQAALKRELRKGDTFFDVGANAGFFTLVAAQLVGPTGKCVAFDPIPMNQESILEQIRLNDLDFCHGVMVAVSDSPGQAVFSFAKENTAQGHLGEAASSGDSSINVSLTTLDEAMKQWGKPDFIKLDVEGAEIQALQGARELIAQAKSNWLIEIHTEQCEIAVRETLQTAGYRFFEVNGIAIPEGAKLPHHVVARYQAR